MDQRIEFFPGATFSRSRAKSLTRSARGCGSPSPSASEAIFRLQQPDGETAPRFDFGGEAII